MLTKDDLQQIRKIMREEVKTEVQDSSNTLGNQLRLTKIEIRSDINDLDDRMKNVEIRMDNVVGSVERIGKDIKGLKKDMKYVSKTTEIIAKNYDEGDIKLDRRVTKIEDHLNLPQS